MSDGAAYKYAYPGKVRLERRRYVYVLVAGAVSLTLMWQFAGIFVQAFPFSLIPVFFLAIVIFGMLSVTRKLEVYPRFLLCGTQIMYFQSVREATLDTQTGRLTLTYHNGRGLQQLTLERELFPTNARKADKIARNKEQKFQKVVDKILQAVQQQAPQAVIKS